MTPFSPEPDGAHPSTAARRGHSRSVTHQLTACGVWDACASDVTGTLQHTPPSWLAGAVHQQAAHVSTSVSVS